MNPGRFARRMQIVICWFVSVLVAAAILCFTFLSYIYMRSDNMIAEWKQPEGQGFSDRGPYRLAVNAVQGQRGLISPRFQIYVGPVSGRQDNGRYFDFTFKSQDVPQDIFIRRSQVHWLDDSIEFVAPDGTKLVIPKAVLVGN